MPDLATTVPRVFHASRLSYLVGAGGLAMTGYFLMLELNMLPSFAPGAATDPSQFERGHWDVRIAMSVFSIGSTWLLLLGRVMITIDAERFVYCGVLGRREVRWAEVTRIHIPINSADWKVFWDCGSILFPAVLFDQRLLRKTLADYAGRLAPNAHVDQNPVPFRKPKRHKVDAHDAGERPR